MHGEKIRTATNNSGGVQGGISNGEDIYFRVAFKPPATIAFQQKTVTSSKQDSELAARGRQAVVDLRALVRPPRDHRGRSKTSGCPSRPAVGPGVPQRLAEPRTPSCA